MKKLIILIVISSVVEKSYAQASACFNTDSFAVATYPISICKADFNGDGKMDLATANYTSGNVSVLLNTGVGNFGTATNFSVTSELTSITSADFNNDGKADLAVGSYDSNYVSVFLGTGTGTFGSASHFGGSTTPLINGDFNGDGNIDIVYAGGCQAYVMLGNGAGSFGSPISSNAQLCNLNSMCCADFNNDGHLDLVVCGYSPFPGGGNYGTNILLGNGTGHLTDSSAVLTPYNEEPYVCSADFNLDGKPDVAVSCNHSIYVLLGNGAGGFSTLNYSFLISGGNMASSVCNGDFNGDGKPDIAAPFWYSNNVYALIGDGTGNFPSVSGFPVCKSPASIVSGDFNNDGKDDIAVANSSSNNVSVLLTGSGCVLDMEQVNSTNSNISVYPNPTNSVINVQVAGNNSAGDIQVTDILGNVLISTKEKSINVSSLSNGVYFVRLGGNTQKFIKQ